MDRKSFTVVLAPVSTDCGVEGGVSDLLNRNHWQVYDEEGLHFTQPTRR